MYFIDMKKALDRMKHKDYWVNHKMMHIYIGRLVRIQKNLHKK